MQEHSGPGPAALVRLSLRLTEDQRKFLLGRGSAIAEVAREAVRAAMVQPRDLPAGRQWLGTRRPVKVLFVRAEAIWLKQKITALRATSGDVVVAAAELLPATASSRAPRRCGPIVKPNRVGDLQVIGCLNILRGFRDVFLNEYPLSEASALIEKLSQIELGIRALRRREVEDDR